jgi:hypothetical protein
MENQFQVDTGKQHKPIQTLSDAKQGVYPWENPLTIQSALDTSY